MLEGEYNLILQAARGDGEAFGVLYDHYHPQIYRFIYLKVGRREEAEDLAHQVFLHAWERFPDYEHRGHPLSSWLYRIARNAVVDFYRSRRDAYVLEELDAQILPSSENLEEAAELALTLTAVRQALSELKPAYQDVVILRFVEELSVRETAAALGKSEGAVKLLQHRAVSELKKRLGPAASSLLSHGPIGTPETI